ncbi:MAG TPA: helix-turn-helix transcriptional regulator [Jatrophihabitans sp.]|nr:helix-turn-helix transcriptional regulator [Jatrophihabitans sp.]
MLTDTELAVYRHLVASEGASGEEIAFALGLTSEQITAARDTLLRAGLAQATLEGDQLVALPPEVALASAVQDDETAVRELRSRITARRNEYLRLLPTFRDARQASSGMGDVQVLDRLDTIRDFLADTCRDTGHELLIAHPTRHLSADSLDEGLPQDLEMLGRGVVRRTLYLRSNRDSVAVQRAVARTVQAGAEVRVLPVIPVRLMCFDARIAMVSRNASPDDTAAVVVRHTDLVGTIRQIYLAAWESADPFLTSDGLPGGLSELDQAILAGLAQGQSDEQIARHQHISVRTCRRHIHDLTERLGAQTRFQAAVHAARQNWV